MKNVISSNNYVTHPGGTVLTFVLLPFINQIIRIYFKWQNSIEHNHRPKHVDKEILISFKGVS